MADRNSWLVDREMKDFKEIEVKKTKKNYFKNEREKNNEIKFFPQKKTKKKLINKICFVSFDSGLSGIIIAA